MAGSILNHDSRATVHALEALALSIVDHGGSESTAAGLLWEAGRVADDSGWYDEAETLRGWAAEVADGSVRLSDLRYDLEAYIEGGLGLLPDYEDTEDEREED